MSAAESSSPLACCASGTYNTYTGSVVMSTEYCGPSSGQRIASSCQCPGNATLLEIDCMRMMRINDKRVAGTANRTHTLSLGTLGGQVPCNVHSSSRPNRLSRPTAFTAHGRETDK